MMRKNFGNILLIAGFLMASTSSCLAMSSENFKINADVIGEAGGFSSSENFGLNDTLGQPVIGLGASENFKAQQGYWYMVNNSLRLEIDSHLVDLGHTVAGEPVEGASTLKVTTDAWAGYTILARENHELLHSNGITTIEDLACQIDDPCTWSRKGFGFSVSAASQLESKWKNQTNQYYAGFPQDTAKTIHNKTGYSSVKDETQIKYRVEVETSQKSGNYSNMITYTVISKL